MCDHTTAGALARPTGRLLGADEYPGLVATLSLLYELRNAAALIPWVGAAARQPGTSRLVQGPLDTDGPPVLTVR